MAYLNAHRDYTRNYHRYDIKKKKLNNIHLWITLVKKIQSAGQVLGEAKGLYEVGKEI